jgi:hypothetical protein
MSAATLVQQLTEFADSCHDEYDKGESSDTLVGVLCAIRDCRADLASLAKDIEAELLVTAGSKRFVVEGLGEVEIRKSIKRTEWDDEGLTRVLVARALDERIVNEQTGEYEPAHESVARVLSECARPSWRVTPLRARGLAVDEFCVERADGYSVQLPRRSE